MSPSSQQPADWAAFFGSSLGAAATLTGLLFVAVSINLERVLRRPRLLARAAETLVGLLLTLTVSAVLLAPQPRAAAAGEVLGTGVVVAGLTLRVQLRHGPDAPGDPHWWFAVRVATVQGVAVPVVIGAVSLLAGRGGGLLWIALGVVAGFTLAVYAAWVLLVEIVRQSPPPTGPGRRSLGVVAPPTGRRAAWLRSLEAHTYLVELMDRDLRRDCDVPLAWYDVLIKIWTSPGHRIRMAELADQVLLSRSWLTRRVVQLEQAGLVLRTSAGEDGRGVLAAMTAEGLRRFPELERSHASSIATHFSAHLSAEEADVVAAVFARVAAAGRPALTRPS